MGQGLKPPAAKKDLPAPFKGGDRVLDRDEVVAERRGGQTMTLRDQRNYAGPKNYQTITRELIDRPADDLAMRVTDDTLSHVPVSERFKRSTPATRRGIGRATPAERRSMRGKR